MNSNMEHLGPEHFCRNLLGLNLTSYLDTWTLSASGERENLMVYGWGLNKKKRSAEDCGSEISRRLPIS